MNGLGLGVAWYAVFVVSATFHEAAHGFTAAVFGDRTAYHQGLVTLDPLPHIRRSPFGMVIIPVISFALYGWMVGWASAPYDPAWSRANRSKSALMSLAGPAANLLLVVLAGVAVHIGIGLGFLRQPERIVFPIVVQASSSGLAESLAMVISILFSLNLLLLVFNLIPLPPLDGSGALPLFLSRSAWERYEALLANPTVRLIGLVVAWQVFGRIFSPIHTVALNVLYPGSGYQPA